MSQPVTAAMEAAFAAECAAADAEIQKELAKVDRMTEERVFVFAYPPLPSPWALVLVDMNNLKRHIHGYATFADAKDAARKNAAEGWYCHIAHGRCPDNAVATSLPHKELKKHFAKARK